VNELLRRVAGKACVAAPIFFCLAACAVVDQYSGRAVVYNLQAEQAQEQALLLNVVRASLRRPMQFTGLQSITGTASASGSITGGGTNTVQNPLISLFRLSPPNTSTLVASTVASTLRHRDHERGADLQRACARHAGVLSGISKSDLGTVVRPLSSIRISA